MSDDVANKLQTLDITSPIPSPALPPQTVQGLNGLDLDLTLPTALSSLINHLLAPLAKLYPPETLAALRVYLDSTLTELYTPSWDVEHPQHGSGFRSLICDADRGLPRPLRKCAQAAGVKEAVWRKALARPVGNDADEEGRGRRDLWEAWCDPGTVIWRYGAWEWEDHGFEVTKVIREPFTLVWQSSSSPRLAVPSTSTTTSGDNVTSPGVGTTPARASRAIPIRAPIPLPAVFAIPPTPANHHPSTVPDHDSSSSATLLPSFALARTPSPAHSDLSWSRDSAYFSSCAENDENQPRGSFTPMMSTSKPINASHRGSGTGSTSSVASSVSEASAAQLLTPGSRPPSADPFGGPISSKSPTPTQTHPGSQTAPPLRGRTPSPSGPRDSTTPGGATSTTPTVTPYDGGNVTVMGGGVKLGGGGGASRPSSVMSQNRQTYDRSRSPSISLASRALTSALGPNANGGARKVRTRRRIMPTYLGHLGQPGVGGPIMGPFGSLQPSGPVYGGNPPTWPGVGVGMAPPPIPRTGTPRISSA